MFSVLVFFIWKIKEVVILSQKMYNFSRFLVLFNVK